MAKFGRNTNVDQVRVPIADDGVTLANYQQSAAGVTTVESSDNVDDKAGGDGALTVRVFGLNAAWEYIYNDVTLNGTTPVTCEDQFIRVFRALVQTAGANGVATGNITVEINDNDVAIIKAGNNQTLMAMFTSPVDHVPGRVTRVWFNHESGPVQTCEYTLWLQNSKDGQAKQLKFITTSKADVQPFMQVLYTEVELELPGGYDIWLEADASADNQTIDGGFDIMYSNRHP
jgi:hypothetical protein